MISGSAASACSRASPIARRMWASPSSRCRTGATGVGRTRVVRASARRSWSAMCRCRCLLRKTKRILACAEPMAALRRQASYEQPSRKHCIYSSRQWKEDRRLSRIPFNSVKTAVVCRFKSGSSTWRQQRRKLNIEQPTCGSEYQSNVGIIQAGRCIRPKIRSEG